MLSLGNYSDNLNLTGNKEENDDVLEMELKKYMTEEKTCSFRSFNTNYEDFSILFGGKLAHDKNAEEYQIVWELVDNELNNLIRYQAVTKIHIYILEHFTPRYCPEFHMASMFGNWVDMYEGSVKWWRKYLREIFIFLTRVTSDSEKHRSIIDEVLVAFQSIDLFFEPHMQFHVYSNQYLQYYKKMSKEYPKFNQIIEWCNNQEVFKGFSNKATSMDSLFAFSRQNYSKIKGSLANLDKRLRKQKLNSLIEYRKHICKKILQKMEKLELIHKKEDLVRKMKQLKVIVAGFSVSDFSNTRFFENMSIDRFQLSVDLHSTKFPNEYRSLLFHETVTLNTLDNKKYHVKVLLFTDFIILATILKKQIPIKLRVLRSIALDHLIVSRKCEDQFCIWELKKNWKPKGFWELERNWVSNSLQSLTEVFFLTISKQSENPNALKSNIEIAQKNYSKMKVPDSKCHRKELKTIVEEIDHLNFNYSLNGVNSRETLDKWLDECTDCDSYKNSIEFDPIIKTRPYRKA